MKKKTAVVFGTFAPLHQGHIDLIQRAKRQCDQVWVVVSGYEGDRGEQIGLTLQKRFRYIREAFRDDELISVCKLDETKLPRYPMGWQEWLDQMLSEISYDEAHQELIFFVGECDLGVSPPGTLILPSESIVAPVSPSSVIAIITCAEIGRASCRERV